MANSDQIKLVPVVSSNTIVQWRLYLGGSYRTFEELDGTVGKIAQAWLDGANWAQHPHVLDRADERESN